MANAAYCTEWYNLNGTQKKIFLILLMQLQMEVNNNTSYGLIVLNLETFGNACFFILITLHN